MIPVDMVVSIRQPAVIPRLTEAYRSNPFIGIEMFITRQEFSSGDAAAVLSPAEAAISVEDTLTGYTINGARQLSMDHLIGTLEAGKLPDFIVRGANPIAVSPKVIHRIQTLATVSGG